MRPVSGKEASPGDARVTAELDIHEESCSKEEKNITLNCISFGKNVGMVLMLMRNT